MKANKTKGVGEIYLHGQIASAQSWFSDAITPKKFKQQLDALGDVETLDVYINSGGGEVFAGQAIYSMLKRHPAHVNAHIDGLAASMASVIAMAADTVYMPANAMMMIHNPWSRAQGDAKSFRKAADTLDKVAETCISAYMDKCGLPKDEIVAIMDAESWYTAAEAKALGFADVITNAVDIAASIEDGMFNFSGQAMPLDKMLNVKQLLAKLPNATTLAHRIDNTPKKEENKLMDFKEVLASLPQDHQDIVSAVIAASDTKIAEVQAALDETIAKLDASQIALAAATPVAALSDEAFLASLPEEVRARYVADQATAKAALVAAQTIQAAAKLGSFVAKAKTFDRIPVKAEDFGKVLMAVSDAVPEAFAQIESVLGAVNAAMQSSDLFKSLGSTSPASAGGSSLDVMNERAEALAKQENCTKEQAFLKVCKADPELYNAYQRELKGEE